MKIKYKNWNPRPEALQLIEYAEDIIQEYEGNGYTLTLRQLYYQFVARDLIENSERSYKNIGVMITKARMAGMISWTSIEDRNRHFNGFWTDEDEINAIRDLPNYIRFDRWERQPYYVEVWVEKEALGNVISRACDSLLVPHMSCKGYLSASELWRASERFLDKLDAGKECVLIHLGDHDPSGIDMTRDNQDRLDLFTQMIGGVDVKRIALNMPQIEDFSPPPNPAKITDTRAKSYMKKYGRVSWELDALEPQVIEEMITNEIQPLIDVDEWNRITEEEEEKKKMLRGVFENWDQIKDEILKG